MHLSHSHITSKSLPSLGKAPLHHRVICSKLPRAFSAQYATRPDFDSVTTDTTAGNVTHLNSSKRIQLSAIHADESRHGKPLLLAGPSNSRRKHADVKSNVKNRSLESDATWRVSKTYNNIWDIFKIRPIMFPMSSDYVSGPVPTERFQRDFAIDMSELLARYSGGTSLFVLRKLYAAEIDDADTTWFALNDKIIGTWLENHLGAPKRSRRLVNLLIGSLLKSADRVLDVLDTLQELDNDFDVRASCLHLAGVLYKPDLLADNHLMEKFDKAVDRLRPYGKWPDHSLHPDIVRLLLWRSNDAQVLGLLSCLSLKYKTLAKDTILLLASSCAARHLYEQTFALLHSLPDRALEKADRAVMQVCAQLLKYDTVVNTPDGPSFQYLTELLEKGLPPDDLLYGRVIQNALASQYPGVAWDVYHHTRSLNAVLPPSTYVQLLRDAFDQQRVLEVKDILAQIHQKEALYKDRGLILYSLNMIRRLCHSQNNMSAMEGLSHILALYDRIWTREPLVHLGIVTKSFETTGYSGRLQPDDYVITFTLWAFVLCHKNGKSVKYLWARIKELIGQGDEMTVRCMTSDLIYNAFIWLNMKHPDNFQNAVDIFRYMISSELCLPTSRTWSVMICGFLYHKQDDKAQKLYEMMLSHGFNIEQIGKEYIPKGATMDDLRRRVNAVMHEQSASQGLKELEHGALELPLALDRREPGTTGPNLSPTVALPDAGLDPDANLGEPVAVYSAGV